MSDKKEFQYSFNDESGRRKISFDFSEEDEECLEFGFESGEFYLNANRAGFLALAKVFLRLSLSAYKPGFHIHLGEDFSDPSELKQISIALMEDPAVGG